MFWGGRAAARPGQGALASDIISSRRLNPSSGSLENWVSSHSAGAPGSCWGKGQSRRRQAHEPPATGSGPGPHPQGLQAPLPDSGAPRAAPAILCAWSLVKGDDQGEGNAGLGGGGLSLKQEASSGWGHSPWLWGQVWGLAPLLPQLEGTAVPVLSHPQASYLGPEGPALPGPPRSVPGCQDPLGSGRPEEGRAGSLHPYTRGP